MQEITIQKWIDFYKSKKSMTKFISLLQKEDLMLLSFTPENLVIEENLPELGIIEEDIKNILYEDVRLNNKLLFIAEEFDIYNDVSKIERTVRLKAERKLIDEKDDKGLLKSLMEKVLSLKEDKLTEEEKIQKNKLEELTSSKKILELEEGIRQEIDEEKKSLKRVLDETKFNFYKELINAKTRLVLSLYHGVDFSDWRSKYKGEFDQVVWTAVIQGEYELYGYDYAKVIQKLIERKIVSPKDIVDYSIPRGVEEGQRYPVAEYTVNITKYDNESEEEFKERKKKKDKELYSKGLKKVQSDINRKVLINKAKILLGI